LELYHLERESERKREREIEGERKREGKIAAREKTEKGRGNIVGNRDRVTE